MPCAKLCGLPPMDLWMTWVGWPEWALWILSKWRGLEGLLFPDIQNLNSLWLYPDLLWCGYSIFRFQPHKPAIPRGTHHDQGLSHFLCIWKLVEAREHVWGPWLRLTCSCRRALERSLWCKRGPKTKESDVRTNWLSCTRSPLLNINQVWRMTFLQKRLDHPWMQGLYAIAIVMRRKTIRVAKMIENVKHHERLAWLCADFSCSAGWVCFCKAAMHDAMPVSTSMLWSGLLREGFKSL